MPIVPITSQEHTPPIIQRLGGRKFVLTLVVIVGAIVLAALQVDPPAWFAELVAVVIGSFSIGAGLAKAGGGS